MRVTVNYQQNRPSFQKKLRLKNQQAAAVLQEGLEHFESLQETFDRITRAKLRGGLVELRAHKERPGTLEVVYVDKKGKKFASQHPRPLDPRELLPHSEEGLGAVVTRILAHAADAMRAKTGYGRNNEAMRLFYELA